MQLFTVCSTHLIEACAARSNSPKLRFTDHILAVREGCGSIHQWAIQWAIQASDLVDLISINTYTDLHTCYPLYSPDEPESVYASS